MKTLIETLAGFLFCRVAWIAQGAQEALARLKSALMWMMAGMGFLTIALALFINGAWSQFQGSAWQPMAIWLMGLSVMLGVFALWTALRKFDRGAGDWLREVQKECAEDARQFGALSEGKAGSSALSAGLRGLEGDAHSSKSAQDVAGLRSEASAALRKEGLATRIIKEEATGAMPQAVNAALSALSLAQLAKGPAAVNPLAALALEAATAGALWWLKKRKEKKEAAKEASAKNPQKE